jgi:hypothetical protein
MYSDRNFLIFPVTELPKVDFSQVCETSEETVRKSVDETKTFVKWDGEAPAFVADIEDAEGPYTYEEILEILSGEEWSAPKPMEEIVP